MKNLLVPAFIIIAAGLTVISSISRELFLLQLALVVAGVGVIVILRKIDVGAFLRAPWFIWCVYGLSIALLLLALFTAPVIRNTRSWIVLGPFQFQPVELAKIGLILIYALYFSRRHIAIAHPKHIFASLVLFALPAGLTLLQPDLGSTTILFGIWFGSLLVSGLPRKWIVTAVLLFMLVAASGWQWFLADYQKARIAAVFYPERDVLGVNYSTIQSKIAIGSGGFWGKGYGQGTQTQLGFLTEPATDFIFAALIEEWGLFMGLLVVAAFFLLILAIIRIGLRAHNNFDRFVTIGVAIAWTIQFFVNAGSSVGIFPVVGVPFPLLSYGGSSMLTSLLLLGIVNAVGKRG